MNNNRELDSTAKKELTRCHSNWPPDMDGKTQTHGLVTTMFRSKCAGTIPSLKELPKT
jgi:hypothetical protein